MNMIYFQLDGLNIRAVMSVISQVLAFDVLNTAKSKCFGKTVIITVWLRVFNWKCRTTIWHYLAILCQIFMAVSLFLTDWEHVSWVPFFFFSHMVGCDNVFKAENSRLNWKFLFYIQSFSLCVSVCLCVCPRQ